jgi:two-component system response regulator AtoC
VEDLPALVRYFVAHYNAAYRTEAEMPSSEVINRLQEYHWPGNIRELENVVRRYVVLGSPTSIMADLTQREREVFQFAIPPNGKVSLKEISRQAVRQVERQVMLKALESNGWKRKKTARMLQISYRALIYKLDEAGICCRNYQQCNVTGDCKSAEQDQRGAAA